MCPLMEEKATMVRRLLDLLRGDLWKPWNLWTWVCLIGCGTSLVVLKTRGNLFRRRSDFGVVDFLGLCTLALCFLAGLLGLTRKGTSRTVPVIALLATILVGPGETLLAFFALAEVPLFLLSKVIRHP